MCVKKLFMLIALLVLPMMAIADESGSCGENVTYFFSESTKTMTISGSGPMANYKEAEAPWWQFKDNLEIIIIEEGVKTIGDNAFCRCQNIISITIPNSVTYIGNKAFEGCWALKSITIPEGVTELNRETFSNCISITSITLPNSLTSIGTNAFAGCTNLTYIDIPNSVSSLGSYVFVSTNLTSIKIPNSMTNISYNALGGMNKLTTITIPSSVKSIEENAFADCYRLSTIYCMNPVPPTCYKKTFVCSNLRDEYDIYNYAILHVPMGSQEIYSASHDWRYFKRIKEDMQLDGKVYYANLTVKQGTMGYTQQAVKADEKYKIFIGSLGGNKVNAVTFNGEDVTEEIFDGYYTTPEIKGESVLSITYETPSNVNSLSLRNVKVIGSDGEICINNIDEPADVYVYTMDGKAVGHIASALGNANIKADPDNVYIVKVGERTYKIAL